MKIPRKWEDVQLTSHEKLQGHPIVTIVMLCLPAIFTLINLPANVGEPEYVRVLRLGIGGMGHQTNADNTTKNCCTHLARLVGNEAYDNRYVPQNCKVTVEEVDGRNPSHTAVVRVRPEILHFAGKGERIVIIENRYRSVSH